MKKKKNNLDLAKKISRENRIARENFFGRPVSKTWDNIPSNKKIRQETKKNLRENNE